MKARAYLESIIASCGALQKLTDSELEAAREELKEADNVLDNAVFAIEDSLRHPNE